MSVSKHVAQAYTFSSLEKTVTPFHTIFFLRLRAFSMVLEATLRRLESLFMSRESLTLSPTMAEVMIWRARMRSILSVPFRGRKRFGRFHEHDSARKAFYTINIHHIDAVNRLNTFFAEWTEILHDVIEDIFAHDGILGQRGRRKQTLVLQLITNVFLVKNALHNVDQLIPILRPCEKDSKIWQWTWIKSP